MKKTMVRTNCPMVSTNWLNKVIVFAKQANIVRTAMMTMAITFAMPAMAGNKNHTNNDKKGKVVAVNNHKSDSHFDKVDNKTAHFDTHKKNAYRPDMKTCTFKASRHDEHKTKVSTIRQVVAKAEHMKGVMDTKWNPRTREVTVIYDAKVISARHIMHSVA